MGTPKILRTTSRLLEKAGRPVAANQMNWAANQIEELRARNSTIIDLLQQHHKWQCEAQGLFMFFTDPKTGLIDCVDISQEYTESAMYDATTKALREISLPKQEEGE